MLWTEVSHLVRQGHHMTGLHRHFALSRPRTQKEACVCPSITEVEASNFLLQAAAVDGPCDVPAVATPAREGWGGRALTWGPCKEANSGVQTAACCIYPGILLSSSRGSRAARTGGTCKAHARSRVAELESRDGGGTHQGSPEDREGRMHQGYVLSHTERASQPHGVSMQSQCREPVLQHDHTQHACNTLAASAVM
jgi:hypothetical protein